MYYHKLPALAFFLFSIITLANYLAEIFTQPLLGVFILHIISYWGASLLFLLVSDKSRIQKSTKAPSIWPIIPRVLCNQLIILPPLLYSTKLVMSDNIETPNVLYHFLQLFFILQIEDFTFYWSHRLLHTPWLYKHIHKQHHIYKAPIAAAAAYAHPIEFVMSNFLPLTLGPLILQAHYSVWYSWVIIASIGTCYSHSGFIIPEWYFPLPGQGEHDLHHELFNYNYASPTMDQLFGTYRKQETVRIP